MNARLTRRDCLDIMCTAIEGGIGYWSVVTDWKRNPDWLEVTIEPTAEGEGNDGESADFKPTTVKYTDIRTAVAKLLKGGVPYGDATARAIRDAEDTGDIDAGIADCIFQVAALGEVVYG